MSGFLRSACRQGQPHEKNLSALRRPPQANARFSRANAHSRRSSSDSSASRQGTLAARGLTVGTRIRQRLRREQRLGSAAVAATLKGGKVVRATRFHLYRLSGTADYPRLALIVPKRLAPRSVTRNRIRRLVREAFRLRQQKLGPLDCVVRLVKAPGDAPVTRDEIEALLLRAAS